MKLSSFKKRPLSSSRKKNAAPKSRARRISETVQRNKWWIAAVVLLAAGLLRLLFLDLKPLHHDEGVNGLFMTQLFRSGYYHYNPANYHGPSLYYFGLITTTFDALFYGKYGLSTFAIRLVPAIFGIGMVCLLFSLRRHLGNFGSLAAAALLAVSPGMVYFSRYFIHEVPFVFLTLALVVTALRYGQTKQPRYLFLASASAALMFATKETCIISFAVLLLAWLCARVYLSLLARSRSSVTIGNRQAVADSPTGAKKPWQTRQFLYAGAGLVFISISVLLYSSFFTNSNGVIDSLRTFRIWAHTGAETTQYRALWSTYLDWLSQEELPILVLGSIGILVALWRQRSRFAVFAAFWALGISAAYSLVPYKTPWLTLNLVLPLAIMVGYCLNEWYGSTRHGGRRASALIALLIALGGSLYQAIDLNFFRYDDDSIPYVYAHTSRQLLELVKEVEEVRRNNNLGPEMGIAVVSPEYWPLPWYWRDNPRASFWKQMVSVSDPVLIASGEQMVAVESTMGVLYRQYKTYDLRPGNVLVLYLRRDIKGSP